MDHVLYERSLTLKSIHTSRSLVHAPLSFVISQALNTHGQVTITQLVTEQELIARSEAFEKVPFVEGVCVEG